MILAWELHFLPPVSSAWTLSLVTDGIRVLLGVLGPKLPRVLFLLLTSLAAGPLEDRRRDVRPPPSSRTISVMQPLKVADSISAIVPSHDLGHASLAPPT